MTDLQVQKRVAALILKCGETRVWIDPLRSEDVASAVTRADVRRLITKGVIEKRQVVGTSRGRARKHKTQKAKGRRRGAGSREGHAGARNPSKAAWMRKIRAIRKELVLLRDAEKLTPKQYRHYYRKAKGGVYTSRAHLISHMRTDGVLPADAVASTQRGGAR